MMLALDIVLLIAAIYVEMAARAVEGWEDERGFHYGRREDRHENR